MGLYFDNPEMVKDQSKCRALVGVQIDKSELANLKDFLEIHKEYEVLEGPEVKILYGTFPYINDLSILFFVTKYTDKKKHQ